MIIKIQDIENLQNKTQNFKACQMDSNNVNGDVIKFC